MWITAGIALVAAAVVVAGWQVAARSAVDGVRIVYDARPTACEGAKVSLDPPSPSDSFTGENGFAWDEDFYSPVIEVVPGMTCVLRLHVVNDGWSDVEVHSILLPGMDESSNSLVRPTFVNPNGQTRLADTEDGAVFAIEGMPVPAGTRQSFAVILEMNEEDADAFSPCTGSMPRSPEATVSALGVERTVPSPVDAGIWYYAGSRDCD